MLLDNASLLIAIAFSGTALMLALFIGWLNARQEPYLAHGAVGICLVVAGLSGLGLRNGRYDLANQVIPFALLLLGFTFIYTCTMLFRNRSAALKGAFALGVVVTAITIAPMFFGFSGIGTILLNLSAAALMMACGYEFWKSRAESPLPMLANAVLYGLTAASFLACAILLLRDQSWILTAPPDNWAERFNSLMCLVGITGIGAITLTQHYARTTRHHRDEANTDPLTGVLNRRALFERFPEAVEVPGLAVLMLDLDHFKQINDRLGHARGDAVLQGFAQELRNQLRTEDVIARIGGEEFCVVLPGLDVAEARAAAERIRAGFAGLAITIGSNGTNATVSAGVATGGENEPFSSVLSRADAALYKAKNDGRNQVHVAPIRLVA